MWYNLRRCVAKGRLPADVTRDNEQEGEKMLDGKKLASLMIANNFCVNTEKIFELKAIDTDSFGEYEN